MHLQVDAPGKQLNAPGVPAAGQIESKSAGQSVILFIISCDSNTETQFRSPPLEHGQQVTCILMQSLSWLHSFGSSPGPSK